MGKWLPQFTDEQTGFESRSELLGPYMEFVPEAGLKSYPLHFQSWLPLPFFQTVLS